MVTARTIHDDIDNFLDYLLRADIAVFNTQVLLSTTALGAVVSWHSLDPGVPFLVNRGDPSLEDYRAWVGSGSYSALLFDGALLQLTYQLEGHRISGHRLAYIPCPYRVDTEMLRQFPVLDVIDLHAAAEPTSMVLHSPIRFDFDPKSARKGHPAAHLTINSSDCRVACMAPMHVRRFADFIFQHFYHDIWESHAKYFSEGARREIGSKSIADHDRLAPYIAWDSQ